MALWNTLGHKDSPPLFGPEAYFQKYAARLEESPGYEDMIQRYCAKGLSPKEARKRAHLKLQGLFRSAVDEFLSDHPGMSIKDAARLARDHLMEYLHMGQNLDMSAVTELARQGIRAPYFVYLEYMINRGLNRAFDQAEDRRNTRR